MPTFPKHITYLLIAIIAIGILLLYFAFTNKKDTNSQNDLLLEMAKSMRGDKGQTTDDKGKKKVAKEEEPEISAEEKDDIIMIADNLCFSRELNEYQKELQKKYPEELKKELEISRDTLKSIVIKFLSGSNQFEDYEQDFYNDNKEEIDSLVHNKKIFATVIEKLTTGITEFTDDELQFQQNYPQLIEAELKRINSKGSSQKSKETAENTSLKSANPPLAVEERTKKILSLFDDEVPKNMKEILPLYIKVLDTDPGKNLYRIFGKLEGKQLLYQKIDGMAYYGLPEWFDGKKLKKEYKSKIVV